MSGSGNGRNKLAKMRLQQRYSSNNTAQTIGNSSGNSNGSSNLNMNNSNNNSNSKMHNQRAKILNLINNSSSSSNSNRNASNHNNGFFKLRSSTKATPATSTTTTTGTATTTKCATASKNNCSKQQQQQPMQLDADDEDDDEIVETLEETTTAVELRSTSAAAAAAAVGSGCNASPASSTQYRGYTTLRSNSTSAILAEVGLPGQLLGSSSSMLYARPRTLNVHNVCQTPAQITQMFFGEVLNAWRAKARCNVVPEERTQELFHELSFHPSQKQICEMLQTAKKVARKGRGQANGLTFGQFCVLAADLKRFRASTISNASNYCDVKYQQLSSSLLQQQDDASQAATAATGATAATPASEQKTQKHLQAGNATASGGQSSGSGTHYSKKSESYGTELRSTKSFSSVDDTKKKKNASNEPVEVFLGGSCNPTTWRADVAIPTLKELGISFYNPQVSDWTPDLIELEHRAKEKARVLFFVMDSETRASAGAIEAAHIAGQNCKQLVLVLHPYKPNQKILNEPISQQEYLDLNRNQLILKELVSRRGLPVLDNIPSGLQRTKEILSGIRDPPSKISSILDTVRGAFDRVNPQSELLTVEQCKRALLFLGYAQSLVNLDNLNKIIINQRESLKLLQTQSTKAGEEKEKEKEKEEGAEQVNCNSTPAMPNHELIDFDLFCVISAYLSVLQQEIHESGCISPIKGTNVPPPQVYFTNAPDVDIYYSASKNISRTSSNASVPSNSSSGIGHDLERQSLVEQLSRSRDSGTSSPQPSGSMTTLGKRGQTQIMLNVESIETTEIITTKTIETKPFTAASSNLTATPTEEEESDSNDSVFSSSSSIASAGDLLCCSGLDLRDVYLGGSCVLRTKWRQKLAMPYLLAKGVSFHAPALHESIPQTTTSQQEATPSQEQQQQRSFMRTRRKCRGNQLQLEEQEELTVAEESLSWSLPPMAVRQNLYNPTLLDSSRVLLFVITNETRSLAPMTLAAHCIGLMYNVVLAVQMLPDDCVLAGEKLTVAAIKDYNRGRSYLIDLAKRQGVPVFNDIQAALECTVAKVQTYNNRERC
ncbi:hypothetical protein KR093_001090 [Drosophila rubida]|uniref:Raw n=1 Tax=Drosophila rubida TaxID=30044 RepID=A0AAD4K4H2_9MUSC|nr:hypothetical protein KR093_001090 [Drosophila rubida]